MIALSKTPPSPETRHIAVVTAFPPGTGSLNEYGLQMVKALVARSDVHKVTVIADRMAGPVTELELGPKVEVRRVWRFNSWMSALNILRALKKSRAESVIYNLQTASFGDREIPAALGLFTPQISQARGLPSGVLMHNLIDAVDLSQTNIGDSSLRQSLVKFGGEIVTKALLKSGYMTVTLDSFMDILQEKYQSQNAFLVPHGTFERDCKSDISPLEARPNTIITMGKFGTYKKLVRSIEAVKAVNRTRDKHDAITFIIGGTDHPATPGYLARLEQKYKSDTHIQFHGYVAEDDVETFFISARLAIFDYDSTTGSSGVLHQAALYGTPAAYPLMGDFVDVTDREGVMGFHFKALDQDDLIRAIREAFAQDGLAQYIADHNLAASKTVTLNTVMAVHLRLLSRLKKGRFLRARKEAHWTLQPLPTHL